MNLLSAQRATTVSPLYRAFSTGAASSHGEEHHKGGVKEKTVFSEDSTWLLLNKYFVYQMCRFPFFVKNANRLTNAASKVVGIIFIDLFL